METCSLSSPPSDWQADWRLPPQFFGEQKDVTPEDDSGKRLVIENNNTKIPNDVRGKFILSSKEKIKALIIHTNFHNPLVGLANSLVQNTMTQKQEHGIEA